MGPAAPPTTVLLVEDEMLILSLVADTLLEHGFAVQEAVTADEALRYMDGGGPFDVLLTDIDLPGSMDGVELATRVRQRRPDVPVIYASGRYRPCDLGAQVPRSVFVAKPYDPAEICTLLGRLADMPH